MAEYRQTLALDPTSLEGIVGLASVLTDPDHPEVRAAKEAAALLAQACEITRDGNVDLLRGLAAALHQAGRPSEALAALARAFGAAEKAGDGDLVKALEKDAAAYRAAAAD